jgi:hypothetical protein
MTGQHAVEAPESVLRRIGTASVWTLVFAAMVPAVLALALLIGIVWVIAFGMTITEHGSRGRHDGHATPLLERFDAPGDQTMAVSPARPAA